MHIYRGRNLLIYLTIILFGIIVGFTITLLRFNLEKHCESRSAALHATTDEHVLSNPIFLVIMILSAPKNILERNTIRQTWLNLKPKIEDSISSENTANNFDYDEYGFLQQDSVYQQIISLERFKKKLTDSVHRPNRKELKIKTLHYFVIGIENLAFVDANTLRNEHTKYNDLILLDKLSDSYANLTRKLLQSIVGINSIQSFKYLLKTDDDTYVKLDYLLEELYEYDSLLSKKHFGMNSVRPELYWGYFNGRATIKRRGPWKEINYNLCERYLPYALGGGYVISNNLVDFISKNHRTLSQYASEDVSLGLWLSNFRNIYRKHDARFDTAYMPRKCQNYHLVLHKRTPANMKDLYRGFLCTFKQANDSAIQRPSEYFYDWSQSQTRCCDTLVNQN